MTARPSCLSDLDCPDPDQCETGTCRDSCHLDPCGSNAICKSRAHASSCSCPIGYTGNPRVQCTKSKFRPRWELCDLQNFAKILFYFKLISFIKFVQHLIFYIMSKISVILNFLILGERFLYSEKAWKVLDKNMFVFAYSTHFVMLHFGMHFVHYILYYTKAYMHFEPTKN